MNDFQELDRQVGLNKFLAKVYGWMFFGLLITAVVAFGIFIGLVTNASFASFVSQYYSGIFVIIIAEVLLVFYISRNISKISASTARFLFLVYASLNGISIGLLAISYANVIGKAFLVTAVAFGAMCVYGLITKKDLSGMRSFLIMGVIGLIVMSLINMFTRSGSLDFIICIAGLAIFLALTAYDTQKLKNFYYSSDAYLGGQEATATGNIAILGALTLYLDFINLFIYMLRLFGRNN